MTGAKTTPLIRLAAIALLGLSTVLYTYGLDRVPPYLSLDEAHFGVHAHAIAHTGRNLDGELLPLFVSLADPLGDQPVLPWGNARLCRATAVHPGMALVPDRIRANHEGEYRQREWKPRVPSYPE